MLALAPHPGCGPDRRRHCGARDVPACPLARDDRLYRTEFAEKKSGNFRLSADAFRALADRGRIEGSVFKAVAAALLKDHRLVLAQAGPYHAVASEVVILRWREPPVAVVRKAAKGKAVLSQKAAWPFPATSKP